MKGKVFTKEDTGSLKLIALALMFWHHLFGFPENLADGVYYDSMKVYETGQTLEGLIAAYGKICMPVFMLLGGFGMYKCYEHFKGSQTQLVLSRLKKLYIKVWQIFIVFVPMGYFMGKENISKEKIDWILNALAIKTEFNTEWWFLTDYVIMLAFFPIFLSWLNRKKAHMWKDFVYIALFQMVISCIVTPYVNTNEIFGTFVGSYYWAVGGLAFNLMPIFLLGAFMGKYQIYEKMLEKFSHPIVQKAVGILLIWLSYEMRNFWKQLNQWGMDQFDIYYSAMLTIGCALVLYGFNHVKKGFAYVAKYSTGMWLCHTFLSHFYFQKQIYMFHQPILIFLWLMFLSYIINVALAYVFRYFGKGCNVLLKKSQPNVETKAEEKE